MDGDVFISEFARCADWQQSRLMAFMLYSLLNLVEAEEVVSLLEEMRSGAYKPSR